MSKGGKKRQKKKKRKRKREREREREREEKKGKREWENVCEKLFQSPSCTRNIAWSLACTRHIASRKVKFSQLHKSYIILAFNATSSCNAI